MNKCWKFEAKQDATAPADVWFYDAIGKQPDGTGLTAKAFVAELQALGPDRALVAHFNTLGGDMLEGLAIYNALLAHKGQKTAVVESVAASMGSAILQAFDVRRIAANAYVGIHNPKASVHGEAKDLTAAAATLTALRGNLLSAYMRRAKLAEAQMGEAMDRQTLYTAPEALAAGLVDEIGPEVRVAAMLDGTAAAGLQLPDALRALCAPAPEDPAAVAARVAEAKAAAAVAEAKAAVEGSAKMVAELQAKLAAAEAAGQAAAESARVAGERAVGEVRLQLAAAQAQGVALQAKLGTLTGGLLAPVQGAGAGGAQGGAPVTFRAAIDAVQALHRDWDPRACWCEAKRLHPALWEAAKTGN